MAQDILASCNCGALKFKTTSEAVLQLVCHCADCRTATGDDFSTIVFFKNNKVEVVGEVRSLDFTSDNGNKTRRFACKKCDTMMLDKSTGFSSLIGVMAARLETPFIAAPKIHVWVQSKLEHVKIPQGVKSFKKGLS